MDKNTITIQVELDGMEAAQESIMKVIEKLKEARALAGAMDSDLRKLGTPINSPADVIKESIQSAIERAVKKPNPVTCTLEIDKKKIGEIAFNPNKCCMCDNPGWNYGISWLEVCKDGDFICHDAKARFCPRCGKEIVAKPENRGTDDT